MADWGELVDLGNEPLLLTDEGTRALVWATEFHLRGQHDVMARRAAFHLVDYEADSINVAERLAQLQGSLRNDI